MDSSAINSIEKTTTTTLEEELKDIIWTSATTTTTTTTGEEELEEATSKKTKQDDVRFSFNEIYTYLNTGRYPTSFTKADKQALRKRSKFFVARKTQLYYIGGGKLVQVQACK